MSYTTAVLALSPVRYYKLGESSGTTAADSSTSNVAGTYGASSGGTWTGGTLGATGSEAGITAAVFNGSSGYVDVGSAIPANGAGAFTYTAWIKPTSSGGFLTLYSRYDSNSTRFEISLGSTGVYGEDLGLVVTTGGANAVTGSVLTLNVWQHVAVVFDGSQSTAANRVRVYVNGAITSLGSAVGTWPTTISAISATAIMFARSGGGLYWAGGGTVVALFSTALSGSDVAGLYAASDSAAAGANLTAATVHSSGAKVTVTFDASATVSATSCTVKVGGYPVGVTATSGSGTTWDLILGLRWVLAGSTVTVTHTSGTVTATNDSEVVRAQAKHVGRQFGMFVHWGYETYAGIEWSNGTESINTFSPTASVSAGIDQWIAGAIAAGMRYIVLVAKHHGGFCLWPSADSTRTIAQTTWYSGAGSPDIVDLFVTKCRAAGLGVGLYFSIWDRWWEAAHSGFSGAAYIAHCQAQLTELLTNYGAIDLIWMDGWGWGTSDGVSYTTIPFASIYDHIKGLQPDCLAIVNDHQDTLASSDLLIYEVHITGGPASGNLFVSESCETIRADFKWFWSSASDVGLSAATINGTLATMTARRSGYLLNCPPALDVLLPAETIQRLADVGAMKVDEWSDPIVADSGGGSGDPVGFPSSSRLGGVLQT
jgi:alpha-L-fucosidase